MSEETQHDCGAHWIPWRIIGWSIAVLLLLLPLAAMQFTDEVNWSPGDFIFMGVLFAIIGGTYEVAVRKTVDLAYRAGVGVALASAFLLIWLSGAVGIIGPESEPANLMYPAMLAMTVLGSIVVLFRPLGLARVMAATALVQALVAIIAIAMGRGRTDPLWPADVLGLTVLFVALWLASAWLFLQAARKHWRAGSVR